MLVDREEDRYQTLQKAFHFSESHVFIVEGFVYHYGGFDHGATQSPNPRLFLFIVLRIEIECCGANFKFLQHTKNQSQLSSIQSSKLLIHSTHTLIATTYETKFFVDFVVRGLHSAAGVHFDTLCGRVRILTSFAVCQQEVFRQDRVASSQQMKGHF